MNKKEFFSNAINWAKKHGFQGIKANYGDFEIPTQYSAVDQEDTFIPDITGKKSGTKNYIEITIKTDDNQRLISKLKLLNTLSGIKGGKLILLAPHGHKAFAERLIERYHLNSAKLVYLRG